MSANGPAFVPGESWECAMVIRVKNARIIKKITNKQQDLGFGKNQSNKGNIARTEDRLAPDGRQEEAPPSRRNVIEKCFCMVAGCGARGNTQCWEKWTGVMISSIMHLEWIMICRMSKFDVIKETYELVSIQNRCFLISGRRKANRSCALSVHIK